ncbi:MULTISPECIES: mechanosensitive ion channel family protein [unclassified Novosphingobium]|uniref:mechanosensitive ion channel family protein n=1 Tax=unclassified Novosphingobium TaxID=2644732 RepID=UPI00135CE6C4|nr:MULTISPECIES: mechanosensitive ion channel domain-containing protein [unclassified Novosphingobium]
MLELPRKRRDEITADRWEDLRLKLTVQREDALELVERGTLRGRITEAQMAELGEASHALAKDNAEPAWVKAKRAALNADLSREAGPAIAARDIHAQASVLIGDIDEILRAKRRAKLFAHDRTILEPRTWTAARQELRSGALGLPTRVSIATQQPRAGSTIPLPVRLAIALGLGLAAIWAAFWCRSALRARIDARSGTATPRGQLGFAFLRDMLDVAIPATALLAALIVTGFVAADLPVLASLGGSVVGAGVTVIYARWLAHSVLAPAFPPAQLIRLPDGAAPSAIRLTTALGACLAADSLLEQFEDLPLNPPALCALVAFAIVVAAGLCLWKLARMVSRGQGARSAAKLEHITGPPSDFLHPTAAFMTGVAVISPLIALAGFIPFARYVLFSTIISLSIICTALFLFRSLSEAAGLLVESNQHPESRYFQLLPLLFGFLIFLIAVPLIAITWGASAESIIDAILTLKNGVSLGAIQVSFGSVMTFGLVFLLGYALTRWLQRLLHYTLLDRLRMDVGARAAILTGFGYLGLTLSAVVAITAAGLDLSNLAFVAGALSVGVGFGLQSVVANFVSGLILLIERPIKEGDWIEVGDFSGHVRKIAFRSTHIETLDKHELIIPNSALTSGNVTNLTYGSNQGRITLPVGVAYGSDLAKAKAAMIEIASNHPRVLDRPAPKVIMDGFGDSAIDLKLLCVVDNVNDRVSVRSDLFFAIVAAFDAARITIPFPQRDLWIHDGRKNPARPE